MRRASPGLELEAFVRLGFLAHVALDAAASAEDFPCCLELLHMSNTVRARPGRLSALGVPWLFTM
jgi:hypothetical protein